MKQISSNLPTPERLSSRNFAERYTTTIEDSEVREVQDAANSVVTILYSNLRDITKLSDEDLTTYLDALASSQGQKLFELISRASDQMLEGFFESNINAGEYLQPLADLYHLINIKDKKLIDSDNPADKKLISLMYLFNRSVPSIDGYKNAIINQKDKITQSPKTYVAASSPMVMDDIKAVGALNSEQSRFAHRQTNPYNPSAPVTQHVSNMVGKDCIGIMAVALKGYSGITIAYKEFLDKIKANTNDSKLIAQIMTSGFKFLGKEYNLATNTDLDINLDKLGDERILQDKLATGFLNLIRNQFDASDTTAFDKLDERSKIEVIKKIIFKEKYKGDIAELKSELLSAATDFNIC